MQAPEPGKRVLDLGLLAPEAAGSEAGGSAREQCPQVVLLPLNSPTGKCLTWVGHWAASWKNLMSLHSTPSMDTGVTGEGRYDQDC